MKSPLVWGKLFFIFLGKSKEIERKTKGFDKILEEKLRFGRDLEKDNERAHELCMKPLVYFSQNTLKLALISLFGLQQSVVRNLTIDYCGLGCLG